MRESIRTYPFAGCLFFRQILLLALVLVPLSAAASPPNPPLRVTIASFSFPPLLHTARDNVFSGTMGETVKYLCEVASITCNFTVMPLKRAYQKVRSGASNALITINVGQLTNCCIPSDWASPWTAGFFSSAGAEEIPKSAKDLTGRSMIMVNGMKSPYFFAKNLDQMAADKRLTLWKAPNILSSVKMFLRKRAPLLWGGEDFMWYIHKLDKNATYSFKPLFKKPVVIWVRKDKPEVLALFNRIFAKVKAAGQLDSKNLLIPALMQQRYIDAPFQGTHDPEFP